MLVYVEKEAFNYPLTQKIIDKFNADVIEINHYKDVFNRLNQDFNLQKKQNRFILAVKKNNFLYGVSKFFYTFGYEKFYYTSQVMNCVYNCEYCYLGGMLSSGYSVIFVNEDDFINEAKYLKDSYLAISYDTDLLAIENITNFHQKWISFAREKSDVFIESRTKSKNVYSLPSNPPKNFAVTFSLSPDEVVKFEKKTPSLDSRLEAVEHLINKGYTIKIAIDPIIMVDDFEKVYSNFIKRLSQIDLSKVNDISIGAFRISSNYFKNLKKVHLSEILYHPYLESKNKEVRYKNEEYLINFVKNELLKYVDIKKLVF